MFSGSRGSEKSARIFRDGISPGFDYEGKIHIPIDLVERVDRTFGAREHRIGVDRARTRVTLRRLPRRALRTARLAGQREERLAIERQRRFEHVSEPVAAQNRLFTRRVDKFANLRGELDRAQTAARQFSQNRLLKFGELFVQRFIRLFKRSGGDLRNRFGMFRIGRFADLEENVRELVAFQRGKPKDLASGTNRRKLLGRARSNENNNRMSPTSNSSGKSDLSAGLQT